MSAGATSAGPLRLGVIAVAVLQLMTVGMLAAILLKPNPLPPGPAVVDTSTIEAELKDVRTAVAGGQSVSLTEYLDAICYALQNPDHPQGLTAHAGGIVNASIDLSAGHCKLP